MLTLRIAADTRPADAAGAIAGQLREQHSVMLQAVGAAAVNQAVKSLALAESYLLPEGQCVASRVRRVQVTIGGNPKTAIQWLAWAAKAPEKVER